MSVYEPEGPPRLGLQMGKRFVLAGVLIVLLSAAAVATTVLLEFHNDVQIVRNGSIPIPGVNNVLDDVPDGQPQTILVLGSDRRFGDGKGATPRSDTIIVMRLDPRQGVTGVMSIPRDLKVDIPGYGPNKINAAYAFGGPKLAVETVKNLLGIGINHVVNVNFNGFQRAVNRLGCVYTDVDRRYFNDHGGPGGYATIDIQPGYQKLCGSDALDYVRYRHTDSDLVRSARQQDFLRQAKDQIGLGRVFGDRKELLRIFGRYTQTDIARRSEAAILGFIKLAYESSQRPLTAIPFPAQPAGDDLEISPTALQQTVDAFVDVRAKTKRGGSQGKKPKTIDKKKGGLAPGLIVNKHGGEAYVLDIAAKLTSLPVYFPAAIVARGGYVSGGPRSYTIADRQHHRHKAYRIVLSQGDDGQYYGVQGTTWKDPPILDDPTDSVRLRRRTYMRYFDGRKIRMIAWRTPKAVYWVSNTLTRDVTNAQMMDVARSLQRVGQ